MIPLSQAIRLGSTLAPQGFGRYFRIGWDGVRVTCALGAAADAIGLELTTGHPSAQGAPTWPPDLLPLEWRPLMDQEMDCPDCGLHKSIFMLIQHINDAHCWSREKIADMVELHELLPVEELEEVAQ